MSAFDNANKTTENAVQTDGGQVRDQLVQTSLAADVDKTNAAVLTMRNDLRLLSEENSILRARLHEKTDVADDSFTGSHVSFDDQVQEMSEMCESLQDRLNDSLTCERQLKDKLKLAEDTINDLESSEINARDLLDKGKTREAETRKRLQEAEVKISELKEIILDKDVYEMNMSEKVTMTTAARGMEWFYIYIACLGVASKDKTGNVTDITKLESNRLV